MQDFQSVQEFRPTKTVQEVLVQGSVWLSYNFSNILQLGCDEVKNSPGLCAHPGLALVSIYTQDFWVAKVPVTGINRNGSLPRG